MSQQPSQGGPSSSSSAASSSGSSFSASSAAPTSSTALTLPPISTIYNFVSGDTASAPERIPQPLSDQPYQHHRSHHHHHLHPDHQHQNPHHPHSPALPADQVSFSTWITPANTIQLAEADEEDNYAADAAADDDDTNFVYEYGRRYHANTDGRVLYPLPNDESEQERDDMKHKLSLWMMHEKLFYAPVEDTLKRGGAVFDLGTGTGEWAMEMAQRYTESQIFGCDISPIQPAYVWENVFFSTADFEEDWVDYAENSFDYIHMRYTAFSIKDPAALVQRAWKYLKPGGYLEFQEMTYWPQADDDTLTPSTPYAFRDFCYYMQLGLENLGLNLHTITRLPDILRSAGCDNADGQGRFDDVTEVRHKLPIGRWARDRRQREKGIWFLRMILLEGLSAICKRPFCQGLGWKDVQVEMFLVDVRRSLHDAGIHSYFPFTVVYGRKPLDAGQVQGQTPTVVPAPLGPIGT